MKVQTAIKKRSSDDQIIRRNGVIYRINKKNPRNKARQPLANKKNKAKYKHTKRKVARASAKARNGSKMAR